MSSKSSKKATSSGPKAPEPILTRTKSAQQKRQLRNKAKKTEKPKLTKPEIKSPKFNNSVTCVKKSLPKEEKIKSFEDKEQVEYYPNNLKRDISTKKIMLKPKHNFKVIASTNKRKMATPQKGTKSPPPSKRQKSQNLVKSQNPSSRTTMHSSSPELSMQDMVRDMEENQSLSEEDFMEILTCPSPVWWEDPPDGRYSEDSIYPRSPDTPLEKTNKQASKRENRINTPSTSTSKNLANIEHNIEQLNKKNEKFVKKKQKLENILGNIKNKTNKNTDYAKNEVKNIETDRNRKLSESTEGDISDMSFNEEEILKNLENMDIPVEEPEVPVYSPQVPVKIKKEICKESEEKNDDIVIKNENLIQNDTVIKNENKAEVETKLKNVREIKEENSLQSVISDADSIPDTNSQYNSEASSCETDKKSEDIITLDSCSNSGIDINEDSQSILDEDCGFLSSMVKNDQEQSNDKDETNFNVTNNNNIFIPNKKVIHDLNHLTEYITIYKIIPEKTNTETDSENRLKTSENPSKTKIDAVHGKLNNFFKHCKNTRRLKKTECLTPAISVKDVKDRDTDNKEKIGENKTGSKDEKNRLNSCEYCVVKTENGTKEFSCEKCESAPILTCGLCNFLADTKEIYRKHVSSCKDAARISWSHSLVLNQT